MPVDDTEYPNVFSNAAGPHPYPVQQWKYNAANNYHSESQIHYSEVKSMGWYKNIDELEHEYLVLECHRPEEVVFYLRIERLPSDHPESSVPKEDLRPSGADVEAGEKNPCKRTILIFFQKLVHKLRPKVVALDSVSQVLDCEGSFGQGARHIARYCDFKEPFYVRDLAFLSCSVNSYEPNYELFVHQCYWHSRTIVDVVTAVYQPTVIPGPHFKEAGTYMIKKGFPTSRITVNQHCENEARRIRKDFEGALQSHDAEMRQKSNKRNGKPQGLNEG